jgi:hypothetical protein
MEVYEKLLDGTFRRKDEYVGTIGHPQCCFFEVFANSPDPEEKYYGQFFCNLSYDGKDAEICKGDYCKCPLGLRIRKVTKND